MKYNFTHILITILLFGIIYTIVGQPLLYRAYALIYKVADEYLLTKQTPFNYKFIQSFYEDNNRTETVVNNNNTNNNQIGINDPPVIKRPDPWLTVPSFAISIVIVSGVLFMLPMS